MFALERCICDRVNCLWFIMIPKNADLLDEIPKEKWKFQTQNQELSFKALKHDC